MARTESTIANYDARTVDEITQRLRKLSQADLAKLETYERQGQSRSTVLERIASLRGETPWPGYDEMEVEEVNDALKQRNGDVASRVVDYERQHKGRTSVIDFAKRRQAGEDGSSARPRSTARAASSRSSGAAKASSRKTTSARRAVPGAMAVRRARARRRPQGADRRRSRDRGQLAAGPARLPRAEPGPPAAPGREPPRGRSGVEAIRAAAAPSRAPAQRAGRVRRRAARLGRDRAGREPAAGAPPRLCRPGSSSG